MASNHPNSARDPNLAPAQYEAFTWEGVPKGMPIMAETDFQGTDARIMAPHNAEKELGADLQVCAIVHDHASGLRFVIAKQPPSGVFNVVDQNKFDARHPIIWREKVLIRAPYFVTLPAVFKGTQARSGFLGVRHDETTRVNANNHKVPVRFGIGADQDQLARVNFDVSINAGEDGRERLVIAHNSDSRVDITYVTQAAWDGSSVATPQAGAETAPAPWPMPEAPKPWPMRLGEIAVRKLFGG